MTEAISDTIQQINHWRQTAVGGTLWTILVGWVLKDWFREKLHQHLRGTERKDAIRTHHQHRVRKLGHQTRSALKCQEGRCSLI